jgi:tetratricopeptide (TPR) repeat protein
LPTTAGAVKIVSGEVRRKKRRARRSDARSQPSTIVRERSTVNRSAVLAVAACALAAAMIALFAMLRSSGEVAPASNASVAARNADAISEAEWREVRARVQALEALVARSEMSSRTPAERASSDADTLRELLARIEKLEAELADLRAQPGAAAATPMNDAASLKKAIKELSANDMDAVKNQMLKRIALRQELLERYPDDPEAAAQLMTLAGEHLQTGGAGKALADLDRFSARVTMNEWDRDKTYANVLFFNDRLADADQRYQNVINNPRAPEHERWNAKFFAAYSYSQKGKYDEARRRFEALIAEAGDNDAPNMKNIVNGAKEQLKMIEQYSAKDK